MTSVYRLSYDKIKDRADAQGMTIADLAVKLSPLVGYSVTPARLYLIRNSDTSTAFAAAIATVLECKIDELYAMMERKADA